VADDLDVDALLRELALLKQPPARPPMDPTAPYLVEAFYPEPDFGWIVVCTGSKHYCEGFLDARRELAPRPMSRLRRTKDNRVLRVTEAVNKPPLGMIAGWPTPEQLLRGAVGCVKPVVDGTWGGRNTPLSTDARDAAGKALDHLNAALKAIEEAR